MFTALTNYIFGGATDEPETATAPPADAQPTVKHPDHEEGEWVLVDKSSRDGSPVACSASANSTPEMVRPFSQPSSSHCRRPQLAGDSSGDSDIGSDISTLPDNACSGETWIVTPPPCFTVDGSLLERLEPNPLENLLIEHPSMSVYGPRHRQTSPGLERDHSETKENLPQAPPSRQVARPRPAPVRSSPRHPRAVAARVGLSSHQQTLKAVQVAQRRKDKRQLSAKQLSRDNKIRQVHKRGMHQRSMPLLKQPGSRACKRC